MRVTDATRAVGKVICLAQLGVQPGIVAKGGEPASSSRLVSLIPFCPPAL